jgi:hypothetical protein
MREPIRVAFAIDTMEAGGTELNAVRLAERLDRDRFDLRDTRIIQAGNYNEGWPSTNVAHDHPDPRRRYRPRSD